MYFYLNILNKCKSVKYANCRNLKYLITILFFSFFSFICKAQVGINTTTPNAVLEIKASNSASPNVNDGLLIPRIDEFSTIEPNPLQHGMIVFVTGNGTASKGFYYWDSDSSKWIPFHKSKHYIGELYGGGIVYYVYDDGAHGLIASLDDLGGGPVAWGLYGVDVNNCENYLDGATNTASIIAAGGQSGDAAGLCNGYSAGGFTDWFLPSVYELRQMDQALLTINPILENDGNSLTNPIDVGGISSNSGFYWTSTEANASYARNHTFTYLNTNSGQKFQVNARVRAIRVF